MREYDIIPEFPHPKTFPLLAIVCQLCVVGSSVFGCLVSSAGFVLAILFQFCTVYYAGLSFCNKYYRVHITANCISVHSIFNKLRTYHANELCWKILRIPWYNSYYILLYSSRRVPIAILRPLWKNALSVLRFPHRGKLRCVELDYLKFLEKVGLLKKSRG